MAVALVSAVFVALLALVVASDLYQRQATLGAVVARRDRAPRTYWLLIALWSACLLASLAIMLDGLTQERECGPEAGCLGIVLEVL
ncbi:conserved hypothetical protein [Altererythrobacter sp. B11]|uniref:hypothetical protein n=1 Tax=Altererythrobacter sp. B11 TaxID=2060312 RepID=UPI000DC712C9|nr:hypothetical protein [Altererythrobacter sp. B11]BBC74325.1 conserved hypothetical protein [Altererythrobacter sp. B11]